MSQSNRWRLEKVEAGLRRAKKDGDESEIAWWHERTEFCRMAVEVDGPTASTPTENWRARLAEYRQEKGESDG